METNKLATILNQELTKAIIAIQIHYISLQQIIFLNKNNRQYKYHPILEINFNININIINK
jgi:hypothetical protein